MTPIDRFRVALGRCQSLHVSITDTLSSGRSEIVDLATLNLELKIAVADLEAAVVALSRGEHSIRN